MIWAIVLLAFFALTFLKLGALSVLVKVLSLALQASLSVIALILVGLTGAAALRRLNRR